MDIESSSKFIGSLTKFLQSLCNGYVEFQRGVELVGHIYLSIDTGEKVDYVLHEKVSKNDENSVTFVSNSFHAQPLDKEKEKEKTPSKDSNSKGANSKGVKDLSDDDDDDIVILDQTKGLPGSTNSGTIPSRGTKRVASPSSDQRQTQRIRNSGSSNPVLSPTRNVGSRQQSGPSATVTSRDSANDNLNMADVKLEQISRDELLSLASQVGEGGSGPSQSTSSATLPQPQRSGGSAGGSGDAVSWIKREVADDNEGADSDTGWSHGRDDSNSNSGSNLYPVMLHQNAAAYSNPAFPGIPGTSAGGPSSGLPYTNPVPGTSQDMGGLDPSGPGGTERQMKMVPDWRDRDMESEEYAHSHMIYSLVSHSTRRNLLPLELRVDLIKHSSTMSQRQLAAAFGISKTQVFAILKKKDEILQMYEDMKSTQTSGCV